MRKENVMMADFAAPMAMASFAAPPIQIQVAQVVIKVFKHSYILSRCLHLVNYQLFFISVLKVIF